MVQVYKIMNGIDKVDKDKHFTMSDNQITRGNSLKIFKKRARTDIRKTPLARESWKHGTAYLTMSY